ncbi:MAG: helix-turn-helix domain-containing protein [Thermodesulfobacteriota bacterium]|nr:helix-turn-helix domain-containing protein [Thermodesulfobacteriota bacterium]
MDTPFIIILMSRALRIEYPDAWYHVMNRARRGQECFIGTEDCHCFIDLLKDTADIFNLRIAAYCLMKNRYHLLVQTPDANLSRCMRHINGLFTQRYNARNGCDGTLFRGRYKSILVDGDTYLLELVRYIHRNPVRAGVGKSLEDYEWSSHRGYVSKAKKWDWLYKEYILNMLGGDNVSQATLYRKFVVLEESEELMHHFSKKNIPSILGNSDFIQIVKSRFMRKEKEKEIPESSKFCPEVMDIKEAICKYYRIEESDLLQSRRGIENEARDLAMYMLRVIRAERLMSIGSEFNLGNYSSVSSATERIRRKMASRKFRRKYHEVLGLLRANIGQSKI